MYMAFSGCEVLLLVVAGLVIGRERIAIVVDQVAEVVRVSEVLIRKVPGVEGLVVKDRCTCGRPRLKVKF